MGLYLTLICSSSDHFEVSCKFEMQGATEIDNLTAELDITSGEFEECSEWGIDKFIKLDEFFDPINRYIINGIITIVCEVNDHLHAS